MRSVFYRRAHSFVLSTRRAGFFRFLYRLYYRLGAAAASLSFGRMPEVICVYLRRSYAREEWEPGLSDIDFFLLIAPAGADEGPFLSRFNRLYGRLKSVFPFLGEVQMGTQAELEFYLEHGDVRSAEAPAEWKPHYRRNGEAAGLLERRRAPRGEVKRAWEAFTECVHSYVYLSRLYFIPEDSLPAYLAWNASNKALDILRYREWFVQGRFDSPVRSRKEMEAQGPEPCAAWGGLRRQILDSCLLAQASLSEFSSLLLDFTLKSIPEQVETAGAAGPEEAPPPERALQILLKQCGPLIEQVWIHPASHVYVIVPETTDRDSLRTVFQALFYARCEGNDLGALPLVLSRKAYNAVALSPYLDWPMKLDSVKRAFPPGAAGGFHQWKRDSRFLRELILESLSRARLYRRVSPGSPYAPDLERWVVSMDSRFRGNDDGSNH